MMCAYKGVKCGVRRPAPHVDHAFAVVVHAHGRAAAPELARQGACDRPEFGMDMSVQAHEKKLSPLGRPPVQGPGSG